ncbi:hypothetical protein MTO96_002595 [Rhipicephalus appendiculatus]
MRTVSPPSLSERVGTEFPVEPQASLCLHTKGCSFVESRSRDPATTERPQLEPIRLGCPECGIVFSKDKQERRTIVVGKPSVDRTTPGAEGRDIPRAQVLSPPPLSRTVPVFPACFLGRGGCVYARSLLPIH